METDKYGLLRGTRALIGVLLLMILSAVIMPSCTTTKHTTSESYIERTDTIRLTQRDTIRVIEARTDSVVVRDSVFTLIKGDTILVKEYHWRDRISDAISDKYQSKTDTCWRERTRIEYKTKTIEIERKLSWWQKALQGLGAVVLICFVAMVAHMIYMRTKSNK